MVKSLKMSIMSLRNMSFRYYLAVFWKAFCHINMDFLGHLQTHPSQTCFMSSVDLHTHYSYQVLRLFVFAFYIQDLIFIYYAIS